MQVVKNAFSWNMQWQLIFMQAVYLLFFVGQKLRNLDTFCHLRKREAENHMIAI